MENKRHPEETLALQVQISAGLLTQFGANLQSERHCYNLQGSLDNLKKQPFG